MSVHLPVPGGWPVRRGHEVLEALERDLREALPGTTVFTHLEPLDDPAPWDDTGLGRTITPQPEDSRPRTWRHRKWPAPVARGAGEVDSAPHDTRS
jgi:hypothetical protein